MQQQVVVVQVDTPPDTPSTAPSVAPSVAPSEAPSEAPSVPPPAAPSLPPPPASNDTLVPRVNTSQSYSFDARIFMPSLHTVVKPRLAAEQKCSLNCLTSNTICYYKSNC